MGIAYFSSPIKQEHFLIQRELLSNLSKTQHYTAMDAIVMQLAFMLLLIHSLYWQYQERHLIMSYIYGRGLKLGNLGGRSSCSKKRV
jgi:hypothetical protein